MHDIQCKRLCVNIFFSMFFAITSLAEASLFSSEPSCPKIRSAFSNIESLSKAELLFGFDSAPSPSFCSNVWSDKRGELAHYPLVAGLWSNMKYAMDRVNNSDEKARLAGFLDDMDKVREGNRKATIYYVDSSIEGVNQTIGQIINAAEGNDKELAEGQKMLHADIEGVRNEMKRLAEAMIDQQKEYKETCSELAKDLTIIYEGQDKLARLAKKNTKEIEILKKENINKVLEKKELQNEVDNLREGMKNLQSEYHKLQSYREKRRQMNHVVQGQASMGEGVCEADGVGSYDSGIEVISDDEPEVFSSSKKAVITGEVREARADQKDEPEWKPVSWPSDVWYVGSCSALYVLPRNVDSEAPLVKGVQAEYRYLSIRISDSMVGTSEDYEPKGLRFTRQHLEQNVHFFHDHVLLLEIEKL